MFSVLTSFEIQINLSGLFPNGNENFRRKVFKIVADLGVDSVSQIMEEANSEVVGPHTSHMMDSSAQIRYVPWPNTNDVTEVILSSKNVIFIKRKNRYRTSVKIS